MAQMNKGFAVSKMNKDDDERTVKSGEYRDALNIQISTSDGSDVGTAQTILGNVLMSSGMVPEGSTCVGSIAHNKEDKIYYLVAGPSFTQDDNFEPGVWKDYIIEYDVKTETFKYVFVDIYKVHLTTISQSGSTHYIDTSNSSIKNVRKEMLINGYASGSYSHDVVSDDVETTEITSTSVNDGWIKLYNQTTSVNVSPGSLLQCTSRRLLNFESHRYVTGINIIDDMLFWTDNHSEPKKINIKRSIAGTGGATEMPIGGIGVFNGDNADWHTRLCVTPDKHNGLRVKRRNDTQVWYTYEENITVVKKGPRTPPRLVMSKHEDMRDGNTFTPLNNAQISGLPGSTSGCSGSLAPACDNSFSYQVGSNFIVKKTGDTIGDIFTNSTDQVHWKVGDMILFNQQEEENFSSPEGFTEYDVRATITSTVPYGSNGPYEFEIQSINREAIDQEQKSWNLRLEEKKPMFEFKFVRFAYRYKYEDGEYSTYSPWSEPAFLPGEYDYLPKKGFNLGMTNRLRQLKITNYITEDSERPQDVVQVDLLYKDESSPNIYTVESIKLTDGWTEKGELLWPDTLNNPSPTITSSDRARGEYEVTSELIHTTVPSNQLLRPWDNVPRVALAQTISANRIVYGNYLQNFDLTHRWADKEIKPIINVSLHAVDAPLNAPEGTSNAPLNGEDTLEGYLKPGKTCRSLRTYQVGVVYGDEYGRETPVLAGEGGSGSLTIDVENSSTLNKLNVNIATNAPEFASYYKFFIKETSNEFYNMAMDRWYEAEDGNIWLSFASADRNKVDEETFIILKKKHDSHEPVVDPARYKILAIENSAPPFIATNSKTLGKVTDQGNKIGTPTGGYPLVGWSEIKIQAGSTPATGITEIIAQGNEEGATDLKAKVHAGTLWVRARTLTIKSNWYQVASYNKTNTFHVFKTDKPYLEDMAFTSTDGFYSGRMTSGLQIEFADRKVERKKEFEGRFFVKIFKDLVLLENLLTAKVPEYRVLSSTKMGFWNFPKIEFDDIVGSSNDMVNWERTAMLCGGELDINHPPFDTSPCFSTTNTGAWVGDNTTSPLGGIAAGEAGHAKYFFKTIDGHYLFECGETGCAAMRKTSYWMRRAEGRFHIDAAWVRGTQDGGGTNCGRSSFTTTSGPGGTKGKGITNNGKSMDIGYIHPSTEYTNWEKDSDQDFIKALTTKNTNFRFREDPDGIVYRVTGSVNASSQDDHYGKHHTWHESSGEGNGNNKSRWRVDFERADLPGVGLGEGPEGYHPTGPKTTTAVDGVAELGYWAGQYGGQLTGSNGNDTNLRVPAPPGTMVGAATVAEMQSGGTVYTNNITGASPTTTGTQQAIRYRQHAAKFHNIEIVEPIEDEDSDWSSTNPAMWETEPKEDVGMDIYYEASPALPIRVDYKTNEMWAPYGSLVVKSPTGGPSPLAGTYIQSWSGNQITLSQPVNMGTGTGSRFGFMRPDGFVTTAITEESGVQTVMTIRAIPEAPALNNNYSDAPHNQPTILSWYNAYAFGNGIESDRIRDDYNQKTIMNGVKASTVLAEQYSEDRRKTGLIHSGIYNSTSNVNNLNQFIAAEKITKDMNPSYGSIQKLHARDTNIIVLHEDKCMKVMADKDALFNADGTSNVAISSNFLGKASIAFATNYGISTNPESFATDLSGRCYFSDRSRSAILRLSGDGITNISDYGMKDWFDDHLNPHTISAVGSFDTKKGLYNISINGYIDSGIVHDHDEESGPCPCDDESGSGDEGMRGKDGSDSGYHEMPDGTLMSDAEHSQSGGYSTDNLVPFKKTLSFSENSKGWISFKSFFPESGVSVNNEYYTFKNGNLYKHHATEQRNFFYGNQYDSSVDMLFNDSPEAVKSFATFNYEGSQARNTASEVSRDGEYHNLNPKEGWYIDNVITDLQSCGNLEFKSKEGKWFTYVKGDTTNIDNLDEKEFSVQGIGNVGAIDFGGGYEPEEPAVSCLNIYPAATCDEIFGCTNPLASNYNPTATVDDGSCILTSWNCVGIAGGTNQCIDPGDGSGMYSSLSACQGECKNDVYGCMDPLANNYDSSATIDDGSCTYDVYGCTDSTAINYNPNATIDDGSCEYCVYGCMDVSAFNYDGGATCDDGSCCYEGGCTDSTAVNYDPNACFDNGSCEYQDVQVPIQCGSGVEQANINDVGSQMYTLYNSTILSTPAELLMSDEMFGFQSTSATTFDGWVKVRDFIPGVQYAGWQRLKAWMLYLEVGQTYPITLIEAVVNDVPGGGGLTGWSDPGTGYGTINIIGGGSATTIGFQTNKFSTFINKLGHLGVTMGTPIFSFAVASSVQVNPVGHNSESVYAEANIISETKFLKSTMECCDSDDIPTAVSTSSSGIYTLEDCSHPSWPYSW